MRTGVIFVLFSIISSQPGINPQNIIGVQQTLVEWMREHTTHLAPPFRQTRALVLEKKGLNNYQYSFLCFDQSHECLVSALLLKHSPLQQNLGLSTTLLHSAELRTHSLCETRWPFIKEKEKFTCKEMQKESDFTELTHQIKQITSI